MVKSPFDLLWAWPLAAALLGCATPSEPLAPADDEWEQPSPPEPVPAASEVAWRTVGRVAVRDFGQVDAIEFPFSAGQRYIAVRGVPIDATPAPQRACHRVAEAALGSGPALLPDKAEPLGPHHQRLAPGPGAGVFVLSTTEAPLAEADTVRLRLALEDCALGIPASRARFSGMPTALRIDIASAPEPTTVPADLTLPIRIVRATDTGLDSLADDPGLSRALAEATERFADIGITLRVDADVQRTLASTIHYAPDMLGFDEPTTQIRSALQRGPDDTRFVPVAIVRCLEFDDPTSPLRARPAGQTTRVPGSFADPATPSLVTIATGDCGGTTPPLDPQRLGVVLAHELGHYLGLHHSDHLGAHLPADGTQRLMDSAIATAAIDPADAWFSPAQATVLRRHPDLVVVDP